MNSTPPGDDVSPAPPAPCVPSRPPAPLTRETPRREALHAERQARQEEVMALHRQGVTLSEMARRLHLTRPTVRTLVRAEACPEPAVRAHILSPYEPYLWQRWTQGCRNARVLWQEIRAQGFRGSYPHVRHAVRGWRTEPAARGRTAHAQIAPPPTPAPTLHRFSARQACPGGLCYPNSSLAEHLQAALPRTRVVKTLNTMLFTVMVNPQHLSTPPTAFLSGDAEDAKAAVASLLGDLGWPAEWITDLGDITTARGPEALMLLVPSLARRYGFAPFALAVAR